MFGVEKALRDESRTIYTNYVQVPIGVAALLIPCWAINLGLYKLHIEFPPSVSIIQSYLLFLDMLLFTTKYKIYKIADSDFLMTINEWYIFKIIPK